MLYLEKYIAWPAREEKAAVNLRFPVDRFGAPKVGKGWSWFPADKITMSENKRLPGDERPFFFFFSFFFCIVDS